MRTVAFFLYFFGYLFYSIPFLNKAKKFKDDSLTVEEQDQFKQKHAKKWASTLVKISGANVTVLGEENVPLGSVLIVANHEGNFDIPVLISSLKKPFGFISKIEVMKIPVVYKWMEVMNCVFMDRKDRRQSIKAIRAGIALMKEGHSIAVFPEGTRSKGGPVGEFKAGSLRLATDAKSPILPVVIKGTSQLMEKNKNWIKPGDVTVSILPAISYEEYKDMDSNTLNSYVEMKIKEAREQL
ncbi:lysophospholipid acyltransferase family protein [Bacillus massiliigorillae]|uniref:lysophospholipid acyltransferase family protein n=1 Tax=Bacillus massiliigorillae TaxID=1243664 RepID=UPI0003A7B333|nr:lysophospholipid acyltransferase family protein [Bacillus massiliigorillae]